MKSMYRAMANLLRRRAANRRRGAAAVEAALVLIVLITLTAGAIEFGYFLHVGHTLQGAASAGARAGLVHGATQAEVAAAVNGMMAAAGFPQTAYTYTSAPADVSTAAPGQDVTVQVSCTWGTVAVRVFGFIPDSRVITGSSVMRKE